jgi:hypothetical protein
MMNRKDLMKTVFDGKAGDRVPVGFWWHFLPSKCHASGFYDNDYLDQLIAGHKKMLSQFKPDLLKIMSDGFFCHPGIVDNNVRTIEDLKKVKHITKDHPWVQKQIRLVNAVTEAAGGEPLIMYNIFSAVQQLRLYVEYILLDKAAYRDLMINHTAETMEILKIVEEDTNMLLDELKAHTHIDGIYYSVQMLQHPEADEAFHDKWIVPSDLAVLNHFNSLWTYNMLHICGYEHYHNNVSFYKKYPCKAYNWATHTDKVDMKEGKEIFKHCVCGGFDNNAGTLIDQGSKEELAEYTKKIIAHAGREGLIIGADCTIPAPQDYSRLEAIRNAGK